MVLDPKGERRRRIRQYDEPRKRSPNTRLIMVFFSFAVAGMDLLGPISQRCLATG